MQTLIVHLTNALLLGLIVIGIPAATSLDWGRWRLNARTDALLLMVWGLGIAGAGNLFLAWMAPKKKKKVQDKALHWALLHAMLLLLTWLHLQGIISFAWLNQLITSLQHS